MEDLTIALDARPAVWYRGTGIGEYTYQLAGALIEAFPANRYLLVWPPGEPTTFPPGARLRFHAVPKDEGVEERELPGWLRAAGAEVYHAPQNGFRAPSPCPVPLVVTVHDLIPFVLPELVRASFRRRFMRELPRILERSDLVVTVSKASREDLVRILEVPPAKIRVVYPGVDQRFHPVPKAAARHYLVSQYQLPPRYILYVGGMNERKNVAELIFAYAKVRRYLDPPHQLVVAGKVSRREEPLFRLVDSLGLEGEVLFPGFIPTHDMPALYSGAALLVYPSLYEGFGLPPLEAMACGTPVVIARAPALLEVAGPAALTVRTGDTLALAEAIHEVLRRPDLAGQLVERGLSRARSFCWQRTAQEMIGVYRAAASGRPNR